MARPQHELEQVLFDLKDATDLDSHVEIWRILRDLCESLMTLEPNEDTTPGVWILDKTHKNHSTDHDFISRHLPRHRIIYLNGQIFDR